MEKKDVLMKKNFVVKMITVTEKFLRIPILNNENICQINTSFT